LKKPAHKENQNLFSHPFQIDGFHDNILLKIIQELLQ